MIAQSKSKELVIGSDLALRLEIEKAKRGLIKEINKRRKTRWHWLNNEKTYRY